jgi:hypothetical protein
LSAQTFTENTAYIEIPTNCSAHHGLEEAQSAVVCKYTGLLGYKIVNEKPYILVHSCPTWEPFEEFPTKEVKTVKQQL